MGLYGIGVFCFVGVFIEVNYDENGIIWLVFIVLFDVGFINLKLGDVMILVKCDVFYE